MRAIDLAFAIGFAACSSRAQPHPPEPDLCPPGTRCPSSVVGSGSAAGNPDSGAAVIDASGSGTLGCGTADSLIVTLVTACRPCITANCCMVDMACSTTACESLLTCTQGCTLGDTLCVGNCENTWPEGLSAYGDFAMCLKTSCSPACPTLQQ